MKSVSNPQAGELPALLQIPKPSNWIYRSHLVAWKDRGKRGRRDHPFTTNSRIWHWVALMDKGLSLGLEGSVTIENAA